MTAKVIVNAKLHEDLAATGQAPKAWAKSITCINLNANGGAALLGEFIGPKRRMRVTGNDRNNNPYRYEWSLDLSNKIVHDRSIILVALGIEYNNTKYYAPIVLFTKDIYDLAVKENPQLNHLVDVPTSSTTQLNYNPKIGDGSKTLASVTFTVTGGKFCVAWNFIPSKQNKLYSAAVFIQANLLASKKIRDRVRAVSTLPSVSPTASTSATISPTELAQIADALSELPTVETHHNRGESPVKEKPHKFQVHPHIPRRMLGGRDARGYPTKNIKLPNGVWFMSDADGVALLLKDGKPRLMHILADYPDEISDEMVTFLKEQAKVLAQISAAYLLVAGMKDQEKDLEPPPD